MSSVNLAMQLIVDGYTVIPDVLDADELARMSDAFEALSGRLQKRQFGWEDMADDAGMLTHLAHPRLTEVVEAFGRHFGQEMVFTNASGARDVGNPEADPTNVPEITRLGWHDDVQGVTEPHGPAMVLGLNCLVYLDDTFAENGAYYAAAGSHHLAWHREDGEVVLAPSDIVLDCCELRPVPVRAGTMIVHRAHNWHGVMRGCQRRRVALQTYGAAAMYDRQKGHTQVSDETLALLPASRRRFFRRYAAAL
jgi:ectoine hydroxylase-related dioxygenase (phytanoyl-CoA dioxygenase family)